MPNPKAPRLRRRPAPGPTGPMLPIRRMRRVGADDRLVDYWQQVWDHLPEVERDNLRAAWRAMRDDALADELGVGMQVDDLPDPANAGVVVEPVDSASLLGVPDGAPAAPEGEPVEGELGVTPDEVPHGKVDDVLGWVRDADDPDLRRARARAALGVEAERTNAKGEPAPRVGVTDALREVAGG